MAAATPPRLPLTVRAGAPRTITVRLSVYERAALPPALDLPHLDRLPSNRTAQQQQSFLFGGAYPRAPWSDLHALHHPNPPSLASTSPGRGAPNELTRQ
ncbi:hypothetical protein [Streptomyces sp. NPDC048643]|uniref:hypothetical protein n=1 Tax=Streptomyces sp. NPDC048643 TaxID=3155637 RepID=UPI0034126E95